MGMVALGPDLLETLGTLRKRFAGFLGQADRRRRRTGVASFPMPGHRCRSAIGVVPPGEGRRVLARVFDESEFLSPYGLRALSKYHEAPPAVGRPRRGRIVSVDYEPGESHTGMFGGNSNWRGPVWMPVNYLLLRNLQRYARSLGDATRDRVPHRQRRAWSPSPRAPTTCGGRLISLFLRGPDGRRPCHGWVDKLQNDPRWRDNITFNEYFHGDNGAGLGATHQTGWTGLVADLICRPDPFDRDQGMWEV